MRDRINLDKAAKMAVLVNAAQIFIALCITAYALFGSGFHLTGLAEQLLVLLMAAIVTWGAATDISAAFSARRIAEQSDMLEDAYRQLEELNATLRKQRHDFKNQLQVVHSLIELEDYEEAGKYIESVYDDIQRVSSVLKTGIPAVNALIAAKSSDCENRKIAFSTEIYSSWKALPIEGYVVCRVLGNLLDNAIEALGNTQAPAVRLVLSEALNDYTFSVENNGPRIPTQIREHLFERGFTTKKTGHGMGLSIVKELLEECGGGIELYSEDGCTRFSGRIPKRTEGVASRTDAA